MVQTKAVLLTGKKRDFNHYFCHAERSEVSIKRYACLRVDPSFLRMTNLVDCMEINHSNF